MSSDESPIDRLMTNCVDAWSTIAGSLPMTEYDPAVPSPIWQGTAGEWRPVKRADADEAAGALAKRAGLEVDHPGIGFLVGYWSGDIVVVDREPPEIVMVSVRSLEQWHTVEEMMVLHVATVEGTPVAKTLPVASMIDGRLLLVDADGAVWLGAAGEVCVKQSDTLGAWVERLRVLAFPPLDAAAEDAAE